jgi:hypothetical protein
MKLIKNKHNAINKVKKVLVGELVVETIWANRSWFEYQISFYCICHYTNCYNDFNY